MATFTGNQVKDTYEAILKLTDNDGLTTSLKTVTDGFGVSSPMSMSESAVKFLAVIESTGYKTPTGTSLGFLKADGSIDLSSYITQEDLGYTHDQSTPSSTWTVTHNLGRKCSIIVVDSADSVVNGKITYVNDNTITVNFNAAFSGYAYCN